MTKICGTTKLGLVVKGLLGTSAISLLAASNAFADGTAAGTNVDNTFTLNYSVSGVTQPQIDNTADPTQFTVDRLVDLTVASGGDVVVAPGATDQELIFSVTNNGNDTQAYNFALVNESGDQFDTTGFNITYYTDDGDGIFEPGAGDGAGTAYTPGSGDASSDVAVDAIIWVVVDGDIPSAPVDTNVSQVTLIADTLVGTAGGGGAPGAVIVADTDGNMLIGAAENILADGTGTANEAANAGDHSDTAQFIIASSDLGASKAVTIFTEDGSGCATIPGTPGAGSQYSVPGACIEYVITVISSGSVDATGIGVVDVLSDDLEFIAAVSGGFTGAIFAPALPAANTDCASSPSVCTISLTSATLAAGTTGTVTIRAVVK